MVILTSTPGQIDRIFIKEEYDREGYFGIEFETRTIWMSDSPQSQSNGAIAAGSILGLLLVAGFFAVGYSPLLSLCMGFLGGASAQHLVKWWHIEEEPQADETPDSHSAIAPLKAGFDKALVKSGLKSQSGTAPQAQYPKRPVSIVEWIVRPNSTRK